MRKGDILATPMLIRVNPRTTNSAVSNKPLKRRPIRVLNHSRAHGIRCTILNPGHDSLAYSATACPELLIRVLANFLASNKSLVNFHRPKEGRAATLAPSLTNLVSQVSCGLLSNVEVTVKLHARLALDASGEKVRSQRPDLHSKLRGL